MRYIENREIISLLRELDYQPHHSEFISEDTLWDVFEWVRDNHRLLPVIYSCSHESWQYIMTIKGIPWQQCFVTLAEDFASYDDALEHAILISLNFIRDEVKNKQEREHGEVLPF